ncbi:MAG TPA: hypothetical protein VF042_06060 [Gemmatimonadaceae bacterium]
MQTTEQAQPAATAGTPAPTPTAVTTVGADGKPIAIAVPKTIEQMEGLTARRAELNEQLSSAASRRDAIAEEIKTMPEGQAKTGLEDRLRILDQRIIQLETDIAVTGNQIASAEGDLAYVAERASRRANAGNGDDAEEGFFAGTFTTAAAFMIVIFFRRWRRKRKGPAPARKLDDDSSQRLERLEQGMDAIAIEIERVAEGQRFVTKLLSEAGPLSGRQIAQPVEARVEAQR